MFLSPIAQIRPELLSEQTAQLAALLTQVPVLLPVLPVMLTVNFIWDHSSFFKKGGTTDVQFFQFFDSLGAHAFAHMYSSCIALTKCVPETRMIAHHTF